MNDFVQFFSDSDPSNVSTSIKLMLLLTVLSLAPSILILMTSFARIIIILSFVRTALATRTNATEPSASWSGSVFNVFYHGSNVTRSK